MTITFSSVRAPSALEPRLSIFLSKRSQLLNRDFFFKIFDLFLWGHIFIIFDKWFWLFLHNRRPPTFFIYNNIFIGFEWTNPGVYQTNVGKAMFDGNRIDRLMVNKDAVDSLHFKFRRIVAVLILAQDVWTISIDEREKIWYSTFMEIIFKGKLRKRVYCFMFSFCCLVNFDNRNTPNNSGAKLFGACHTPLLFIAR